MKEIQAQLYDCKKHAENAEQVTQQAEGRAAEAEKHLKVEKENAATTIAEACRQLRQEVEERTAFENAHTMMLDDFEQRLPAGEGTSNVQCEYSHVQTPSPSSASATVERENVVDNDTSEGQGRVEMPVNGTRARPHQVRYFYHSNSILKFVASRHLVFFSQSHQKDRSREDLHRHLQPGNKAAHSLIQGIHNRSSQALALKRNWISY